MKAKIVWAFLAVTVVFMANHAYAQENRGAKGKSASLKVGKDYTALKEQGRCVTLTQLKMRESSVTVEWSYPGGMGGYTVNSENRADAIKELRRSVLGAPCR